jgi:hypothetical protein
MAYATCRIAKQQRKNLAAVQGHNMRTITVEHCDPDGQFNRIVGDANKTSEQLIDERLEQFKSSKLGLDTVRKDAVVGVELVLGASPEYFRPTEPEKWGSYEQERVDQWLKATTEFLEKKYGKARIVEIVLHLDEATPHIHAVILPVVKKTKNKRRTKEQIKNEVKASTYTTCTLDAKTMFDPENLVKLQTEYAQSVEHLGLKRGLRGSKAKHKKVQSYYGLVNAPEIEKSYEIRYPTIEKPPVFNKENWVGLTQEKVNSFIDKQLDKAIKQANKLKKLADNYKALYEAEKQRTAGYWHKFGSPENAQKAFTELEEKVTDQQKTLDVIKADGQDFLNKVARADSKLIDENHNLIIKNRELTDLNERLRATNQSLTNQQSSEFNRKF